MLYKAAVCLLEDITSLNLTVSLTEPWALRLSRRQTRGGEGIDSCGGKANTAAAEPDSRREEVQLGDGKTTLPVYDLYMETIFSAHRCTHIQHTNYILYAYLSCLIVIMRTWVMHTHLEIRDHTEAQLSKASCHPHQNCLRACFSAVVVYLEICRQFQR